MGLCNSQWYRLSFKHEGKGAPKYSAQKLQQLGRWKSSCRARGRSASTAGRAPAGLSTEGLMVGGRTMRIPWHESSPTCLGTKPLCMAGQSLTFLRHSSGDRRQQRERSHQAPPPNPGTHCRGHRVGCTEFSLLALAYLPKLPQGQVCYRIREMGQGLDLGEQTQSITSKI